jgi:PHD/YefM family antitoxin component YafN of YafNO toxin-antitoxin module
MRWLISIITIIVAGTTFISAATLSDAKILEASENIKYLTQKIAKDYLYLYTYPEKQDIHHAIRNNIKSLEENIRSIAITTKNEKIKYILDFFAYEKEQIKITLNSKMSKENVDKVLDFSEALTEGAENIVRSIQYNFSIEEKMFMRSKNIEYLVEKLAKYYMVLASDINKATIPEKVKETIRVVEEEITKIQQYTYPKTLDDKKKELLKLWTSNKHYYHTVKTVKIPSIMLLSTNGLQNIINQIAIHHSKGE